MALVIDGITYVPYEGYGSVTLNAAEWRARYANLPTRVDVLMETLPGRVYGLILSFFSGIMNWTFALLKLSLTLICMLAAAVGFGVLIYSFEEQPSPDVGIVRGPDNWWLLLSVLNILHLGYSLLLALSQLFPSVGRCARFIWHCLSRPSGNSAVKGFLSQKVLERAVQGSVPSRGETPRFQFEVCLKDGTIIGNGFRAGVGSSDLLVTAAHNLEDEMLLRTAAGSVLVKRDDFIERPLSDVAFLPFVGSYTVLALGKAKLVVCESKQTAMICHNGMTTIGSVEEMACFGLVSYSGTTLNGYSGAPYYFGNAVFGMHCGSSSGVNFGVEAQYLPWVLSEDDSLVNSSCDEDSWEWLEKKLSEGKSMRWKRSSVDPSMIRVSFRGRYYEVDTDDDVGKKIYRRLRGLERSEGKTSVCEPEQTVAGKTASVSVPPQSGKIPAKELPQVVVPSFEEQVATSFLGKRQLLVRKEPSAEKTPTTSLPTPMTKPLATAGLTQERTPLSLIHI